MMKKHIILKNLKWILLACVILGVAGGVVAVNPFADIEYPVEELGRCQNREECKQFCDKPENMESCLEFAKKIGLMSDREVEKAKKMAMVGEMEGPGGCVGEDACEIYCDQIDNMRECIEFAEENGLLSPDELEEAKRVIRAIDQGITPPNCNGKRECDIYCSQVEHMEECIEFGIAAGMMPAEEQVEARKMLTAIKAGIKPPDCNGPDECDIYCSQPEHMQECMEFSMVAGLMPPEEVEDAQKMLKALKAGVKPPNCRGNRECDIYCSTPENMEECMEFSIAGGFMPEGEIEMMQKTLQAIKSGVLPPNCRGDRECEVYCQQEENIEECINFSVAAGFMSVEEGEMAKKTRGKGPGGCVGDEECRAFCDNIDNARECIQFGVKMGDISQEEADQMIQDIGGSMGSIFDCVTKEECEKLCQSRRNENELMCIQLRMVKGEITQEEAERIVEKEILQKGPGGPGGCRTIKECEVYCQQEEHMEECMRFTTGGRMGAAEFQVTSTRIQAGPGGCITPEECQKYCEDPAHKEECFGSEGGTGMIDLGEDFRGPGDCRTLEGCTRYCTDPEHPENKDECMNFCAKPENATVCMMSVITTGVYQPMTPQITIGEDDEYLRQMLKEEYGDEWQKVYDEKMIERMEGMAPVVEWQGQQGIEYYRPSIEVELQKPPEGDDKVFRYTPGEVNEVIYDTEQSIREGIIIKRLEPGDIYIKEEWRTDADGGWTIDLKTERLYLKPEPQPLPEENRTDEWIDTSVGTSDSWGEMKIYKEPVPTVDEPTYNIMPSPESIDYIEPQIEPMPAPILKAVPMPELAPPPIVEPAPMPALTPMIESEPPQGLFAPFKKFLGAVAEFLSN